MKSSGCGVEGKTWGNRERVGRCRASQDSADGSSMTGEKVIRGFKDLRDIVRSRGVLSFRWWWRWYVIVVVYESWLGAWLRSGVLWLRRQPDDLRLRRIGLEDRAGAKAVIRRDSVFGKTKRSYLTWNREGKTSVEGVKWRVGVWRVMRNGRGRDDSQKLGGNEGNGLWVLGTSGGWTRSKERVETR
jgi:hypothetical protein